MNDLTLVNYRTAKCEPLKSITRLPKREAFALAKKIYEENHRDTMDGIKRFGDEFEFYYHQRIKAEKWLYEEFIARGGKPKTKHPLYFFVHGWNAVEKAWEGKVEYAVTSISLREIDECDVSFVFGDSMVMVDKPDRKIFLKNDLHKYILSSGSIEKLLDNCFEKFNMRAIEAQIWSDESVRSLSGLD